MHGSRAMEDGQPSDGPRNAVTQKRQGESLDLDAFLVSVQRALDAVELARSQIGEHERRQSGDRDGS